MPLQLWRSELRHIVELIEIAGGLSNPDFKVVPSVRDAFIPELLAGIRSAIATNVVETAIQTLKGNIKPAIGGKGKADRSEPYGGKGGKLLNDVTAEDV